MDEILNSTLNKNKNINVLKNTNIENCKFLQEETILFMENGEKIYNQLIVITEKKQSKG